jgi:predicted DNA-binding WGR domain protein
MPLSKHDLPRGLSSIERDPTGFSIYGRAVLLEFRDAHSDKFWGAFEDEGAYIVFWGRNGRRPQQSQRISESETCARLREKIAKGYKPSDNPEKLQEMFLNAPEWFDNLKFSTGNFMALVERAKIELSLDKAPKAAAAESKKRASCRL